MTRHVIMYPVNTSREAGLWREVLNSECPTAEAAQMFASDREANGQAFSGERAVTIYTPDAQLPFGPLDLALRSTARIFSLHEPCQLCESNPQDPGYAPFCSSRCRSIALRDANG